MHYTIRRAKGFSMIEMIIVISVIALVAGLAIAHLAGIHTESKKQIATLFVKQSMKLPLQGFRMKHNRYPSESEGLKVLLTPPPLIENLPTDPWGNPYQYRFPAERSIQGYDLFSFGPDGVPSNDDIGNWSSNSPHS